MKILAAGMVAAVAYYTYLSSLYIVDETMECPRRPLSLEKQLITFRVGCFGGEQCSDLDSFINHYSACTVTNQIQIFHARKDWKTQRPTRKAIYLHSDAESDAIMSYLGSSNLAATEGNCLVLVPFGVVLLVSCMVSFVRSAADGSSGSNNVTFVAGVLYLNPRHKITCADLEFVHNVWSSSPDAVVGFSPLLSITGSGTGVRLLGSLHVWWYGAYTLFTSSGVFKSRNLLWNVSYSELLNVLDSTIMELLAVLGCNAQQVVRTAK
jgi:hypothetical protein